MLMNEIDPILMQFEYSISDLTKKYDGKQSDRLFANTVWMTDFLDSKVRSQLNTLRDAVESLDAKDLTIQNNVSIIVGQIKEIESALNALLFPYKNRYDLPQIYQARRGNLPTINEKLRSLRHRVDIITNTMSQKKKIEQEDWYDNL